MRMTPETLHGDLLLDGLLLHCGVDARPSPRATAHYRTSSVRVCEPAPTTDVTTTSTAMSRARTTKNLVIAGGVNPKEVQTLAHHATAELIVGLHGRATDQ